MADIRAAASNLPEPLTDRECEILACLVEGLSNAEIAARLHLALRTVKWYNSQIYTKLGIRNRKEAIEQAAALGLLDAASDSQESVPRNNLPLQPTPFVGRERDLKFIASQFADPGVKLVTILAQGGMGKTRLALAVAERQLRHFRDGVFFVPLAPLSSPDDMVTAIADNVGFSFYGSASPRQQLIDYVRERRILLVLDNREHLLDGVLLVAEMVQTAPGLHVLTTSRERLNLQGETVYMLRGLDFPMDFPAQTPERIQEYDATKLFMQSAQRVHPGFELQTADLAALARIFRLTAGMPLAIELAAVWLDILSLDHIANEIQQGIDILETDLRDVPERHRSIRATFERTWSRLAGDERAVFGQLSVFRGGFTLSAAQGVAGASVRHLRGLEQKALIQTEGNERFTIHELLRQFGADKLAETSELPAIQIKHALFFADFMAGWKQSIRTNHQLEALALIDADFENVRVAWLHIIDQHAWDQLPKFLHSLWFYCDVRTRRQEAIEMFEPAVRALRSVPLSDETELALGRVLAQLGEFYRGTEFIQRAEVTCDEAIRILRQYDSPEDLLIALLIRIDVANNLMQHDLAVQTAKEGLELARSIGDTSWEAYISHQAGWTRFAQGDWAAALLFAEDSLSLFVKLGSQWGLQLATILLAWIKESLKEYDSAQHLYQQALTLAEGFEHAFDVGVVSIGRAKIALHGRNYAVARLGLGKGLQVWRDAGYKWFLPYPLVYIVQMFVYQNELDRAVEILAALPRNPLLLMEADQLAQALRDELQVTLEPERFTAAWIRGQAQGMSAIVARLVAELTEE